MGILEPDVRNVASAHQEQHVALLMELVPRGVQTVGLGNFVN